MFGHLLIAAALVFTLNLSASAVDFFGPMIPGSQLALAPSAQAPGGKDEKADVYEPCKPGQRVEYFLNKEGKLTKKVSVIRIWWVMRDTGKCEQSIKVEGEEKPCVATYRCVPSSPGVGGGCQCQELADRSVNSSLLAQVQGARRPVLAKGGCAKCAEKLNSVRPGNKEKEQPSKPEVPTPQPAPQPQPAPAPAPAPDPLPPPREQLPPPVEQQPAQPPTPSPQQPAPPENTPPPPPPGPSAGDRIGDIARGPADNYSSNYSNYGKTPPVPDYSPTGLLDSYSGISGSSYSGSSYNPAPAGGSVAYAPGTYGPSPVTNPYYDSLDSQNTFAQPLQTPYGSISQLSKNAKLTAEQRAVLVLVDTFEKLNTSARPKTAPKTTVLRNSITNTAANFTDGVRDVLNIVSDLFSSTLVPSGDRELSEEEKAAEEARKALRFFLEPQDKLLAAGDPEALPTEIPDDEFQSTQGSGGDFSQAQTFSSGDGTSSPASGATGVISNSQGQTTGGGGIAAASGSEDASSTASGSASGESIEEDPSEPQGVVAKIKKAIGSLVSAVTKVIQTSFLHVLSWF